MALVNYTLPFGSIGGPSWATLSPLQHAPHATAVNSLLYGPSGHQESDGQSFYKNQPYAPPTIQQQQNGYNQQYRPRNNNYLPPPTHPSHTETKQPPPRSVYQQPTVQQQPQPQRTYGENSYSSQIPPSRQVANGNRDNSGYYNNNYDTPTRNYLQQSAATTPIPNGFSTQQQQPQQNTADGGYPPSRLPPTYTKVQSGVGSHTQVHAILDYDPGPDDEPEDEYYDDDEHGNDKKNAMPNVTPIQGPIYLKNGTVPVVPLFAYNQVNNGTFLQIPIWWTALSVALGLNIRGDIIRGTPCVKRFHQLFCPTAGNSYPIKKIETFIDENKALMKRMYGDFQMTDNFGPSPSQTSKRKRSAALDDNYEFDPPGFPNMYDTPGDSYFNKLRNKRQSQSTRSGNGRNQSTANGNNSQNDTGRVDACESKVEIVTPYWASNSAGKIRAIVNTQHFEQAIHQEVCTKTQTNRCSGDCGCEQKYKWHRLLAYDPDNDCKGIFMDWFLFPSCCVCRCNRL